MNSGNIIVFGQQSITEVENPIINIVIAGDFYCNDETEDIIEDIIDFDPELIITTGDHVKDEKSADCWIEMTEEIKEKIKIAIGNHDTEFSSIYDQLVNYHNLQNPYYSHDFKNIHFISMSTEHPFEEGSEQYEFIKNDLENIPNKSSINWIIVHLHNPFYSTHLDLGGAEKLRDTFLPLFEKYGVDLVFSGHNQYYERTYPILYNKEVESITDKREVPEPIVTDTSSENYANPLGIIFFTVGTGGDDLGNPKSNPDYLVIQEDDEYGFLHLVLDNDGKTLVGEFRTGDDEDDIEDKFELTKS
ncbi:MAG: metallophosphoesterase [Nitrososphaeraceae archaeon]